MERWSGAPSSPRNGLRMMSISRYPTAVFAVAICTVCLPEFQDGVQNNHHGHGNGDHQMVRLNHGGTWFYPDAGASFSRPRKSQLLNQVTTVLRSGWGATPYRELLVPGAELSRGSNINSSQPASSATRSSGKQSRWARTSST